MTETNDRGYGYTSQLVQFTVTFSLQSFGKVHHRKFGATMTKNNSPAVQPKQQQPSLQCQHCLFVSGRARCVTLHAGVYFGSFRITPVVTRDQGLRMKEPPISQCITSAHQKLGHSTLSWLEVGFFLVPMGVFFSSNWKGASACHKWNQTNRTWPVQQASATSATRPRPNLAVSNLQACMALP